MRGERTRGERKWERGERKWRRGGKKYTEDKESGRVGGRWNICGVKVVCGRWKVEEMVGEKSGKVEEKTVKGK